MNHAPADRRLLPLLLVIAVGLAVGVCGWGTLYNETDGQYAGAARIMVEGGSWLIPENNGVPRLVKPPFLYWMMAASMRVFGVTEFAARLPGALALCALTAVAYLFAARSGGPWRGFLAGAIMLTFLGSFTLGRIVMPEPVFSAFLAASLYCALRGADEERHRRRWFLGFWLLAGLASFTKGWHGLLYPLLIVGLTAILSRNSRMHWKELLSWQGALIFLLINLPWYFYIESKFPGYLQNLIFAEQMGHLTGSDSPATDYTSVPRWQFLLLHLAWFFPWSLVVGVVWVKGGKGVDGPALDRSFLFSWMGVVLGTVLLVGERQDYYAMTMWPAAAWLFAMVLDRNPSRAGAIALAGVAMLGLLASFAFTAIPSSTGTVVERATAWTTITSFDSSVWLSLRTTAWLALGGAAVLGVLAAVQKNRARWGALVLAAVCLDLGAVNGTALVAPYFSLAQMAPALRDASVDRVFYDGNIDTGSSLLFYTDLPVMLLNQRVEENFIAQKFGIGRERYLATDGLIQLWKSGNPVALVTESRRLPDWRKALGDEALVPSVGCGTQVLLKNRP